MASLASVPAFIKNAIDHELLKTADKIHYSIEKGEEMTTSYQFRPEGEDFYSQLHAMNKSYHQRAPEQSPGATSRRSRKGDFYGDTINSWDTIGDSGGEYSPCSPSLASNRKYTSSATSGGYHEELIFSKSSQLPVTMSKHTIEYLDEHNNNNNTSDTKAIDRSAEWTNWYNREIAPAMERNSVDSSRQWQEWTKREVSTTTPVSPFEERTVSYQREEGTSFLNPDAPIKTGPGSQVIKHETFEEETSEKTFEMPQPPKFYLTRARSNSPTALRKSVNFGSVAEITTREQEFYPFRDAHQGKPLPGDNEFGTWGRGLNDPERQWKLSNGQWVRVGGKKQRDGDDEPDLKNWEKHLADTLKQPKMPSPGSKASPADSSNNNDRDRPSQNAPIDFSKLDLDDDPDRSALRDKYRPKPVDDKDDNDNNDIEPTAAEQPLTSSIQAGPEPEKPDYNIDIGDLIKRYEPEPEPIPEVVEEPPKRIVLEPVEEVEAEPEPEFEEPVKMEEPKKLDDPVRMWMKMGPAQYGPPFGSLRRRKGREEEWVGPPCELCHKQIEERRCMLAENMKFHCWHFACSFCMKTLKVNDFLLAEADKKPYCLNCHKREFPEISLVNLNLDKGTAEDTAAASS